MQPARYTMQAPATNAGTVASSTCVIYMTTVECTCSYDDMSPAKHDIDSEDYMCQVCKGVIKGRTYIAYERYHEQSGYDEYPDVE